MSENTSTRLKKLMDERSLKQVDIIRLAQPFCEKYHIKLGKSDLSQFINGKVEPGQWKLTILGLALDVSEAWLMGYDVPREREKPSANIDEGLLDDTLIKHLSSLTSDEIGKVTAFVQGLLASR